jgi:hypothetical protein
VIEYILLLVTKHLCYEILSLILFPLLPPLAIVIVVIIVIVHLMIIAPPALHGRGRGGGGGEYNGECLFDDDSDDNEYNNDDEYDIDNEYDNAEDGKGSRRRADGTGNLTTTVATLSAGCLSVAWGIGCQSLAPTPPPPSLMMMMMTLMITAVMGGCRAPPLCSAPSRRTPLVVVPSRLMPLIIFDVTDRRRWRRHKGVWGVVVCMVEEEGPRHCTHSSGSDPTRGGRWGEDEWCDVGRIAWQTLSG